MIRAGWRATGLIPFNVELVLGSSQVYTQPISPLAQELTHQLLDAIYRTPTRPQDLHRAQQELLRTESLSRSMRIVLAKATKALANSNTRAAGLEAENDRLKHQLEALRPQAKRRKIAINPNQLFADVETIRSLIAEAAAAEAQSSTTTINRASTTVAAVAAAATLSSMQFEWKLN